MEKTRTYGTFSHNNVASAQNVSVTTAVSYEAKLTVELNS